MCNMEKRYLLILMLLLPSVHAIECISYKDCTQLSCIGSARMCIEGLCSYTDCIPLEKDPLKAISETTGISNVVGMSSRFMILALAIVAVALIFPVLKLHDKAKVIAVIGFILVALVFLVYLIGGSDTFENIFTSSSYGWDPDDADRIVINFLNSSSNEVDDKLIAAGSSISGGKEYRIRDDRHESSVVILRPKKDNAAEGNKIHIMGKEVLFESSAFHDMYSWREKDLRIIVQGEKEQSKKIAYKLLRQNISDSNTSQKKDMTRYIVRTEEKTENGTGEKPKKKQGAFPVINITAPGDYTDQNITMFRITDNDSLVDHESLRVSGVEGFSADDCYTKNKAYICSFSFYAKEGMNTLFISVADEEGHMSETKKKFIYDTERPKLRPIYPENSSYINTRNIHMMIEDENILDSVFSSMVTIEDCKESKSGLDCQKDNVNLTEGKNTIVINATDKAGNTMHTTLEFTYDITRPTIEITDKGFILSDNFKLRNDSLLLNRQKYSMSNCYPISGRYHCRYSGWIQEISITDMAGNIMSKENKPSR